MSTDFIDPITAETLVDDLMRTHTITIRVFIRRKMMCVGCPVARFHDVRQACIEHDVLLQDFLHELDNAIIESTGEH